MEDLSENLDLALKLKDNGIEIDPTITGASFMKGVLDKKLKIGDIGKDGYTIEGFYRGDNPDHIFAVLYDETKGSDDAFIPFKCQDKTSEGVLLPSGELSPEVLSEVHADFESAVEMAEMGMPTPLDQIPSILLAFELMNIDVPEQLSNALEKVILEHVQSDEFKEAHPDISVEEDEDGLKMLMPSGEMMELDDSMFEE